MTKLLLAFADISKKLNLHWTSFWSYYLLAAIFTILICKTSWPGFMSFDSLDALNESRTGIHWNINCPTMVIWLQAICDHIYAGPGLLFLFQVSVTFFALADIFVINEISLFIGIPFMIFFACCPAILGPMLVVWKDVGMMAFFLAATAALFRAQKNNLNKRAWDWTALGWTVLASGYRLNAVIVSLPLFFAISKSFSGNKLKKTTSYFAILVLSTATTLWFINSFKLKPDISLIDPYPAAFFQAFDILGISALSKENLLPKELYAAYDNFSTADLVKDYYPENSNKAYVLATPDQKPLAWKNPAPHMTHLWQDAVVKHPKEYLRHRMKVFRALLAIHMNEPYYLTHPGIDGNDLGITFKPSKLTPYVLSYLNQTRSSVFAHPWFYYLIALALILLVIFFPSYRSQNIPMLLASATLNILPMFFLVASAELRFNMWSIAAITVSSALIVNYYFKQKSKKQIRSFDQ